MTAHISSTHRCSGYFWDMFEKVLFFLLKQTKWSLKPVYGLTLLKPLHMCEPWIQLCPSAYTVVLGALNCSVPQVVKYRNVSVCRFSVSSLNCTSLSLYEADSSSEMVCWYLTLLYLSTLKIEKRNQHGNHVLIRHKVAEWTKLDQRLMYCK